MYESVISPWSASGIRKSVLVVAITALMAMATVGVALAASNTFTDNFDSGLGSHLEDPASAFTVTSGEVHQIASSGKDDRQYVRTTSAYQYDTGDWTYTITFDKSAASLAQEIIFVGVGLGAPGTSSSEPASSVFFRIHSDDWVSGPVDVFESTATGALVNGTFGLITSLANGKYKAQIKKVGSNLTFSILDMSDVVLATRTRTVPAVVSDPNARLFFGNAKTETTYDDMIVEFTPPAPSLPTTKAECKKGGWEGFSVFKNQGDCVSYVATGGTNPPAN